MKKNLVYVWLGVSALVAAAPRAPAQTPLGTEFAYQGQLKDGGSPASGSHDLQFTLYGVPSGGTIVAGPICADNVGVADGLFTVPLDFGAVFDGNERWLEIGVRADSTPGNCGSGSYTPLSPRQELTAVPYALSVRVPLTLSGTSATHIIRGENASTVNGSIGVSGLTTAASGNNTVGGFFQSDSTPSGINGTAGVVGYTTASSGFGNGVFGGSNSTSGRGVFGRALAASGETNGVLGQTDSNNSDAAGVRGEASSSSVFSPGVTYGVDGESAGIYGVGVRGVASAGSAVSYGVLGQAGPPNGGNNGWAVFANGDMGASGAKLFRIDHPDDPANKYLLHYCAESPEVINFYSGKATLNGAGQAVVTLPHYFAKINKDPRYTLTAVGAPMPMLHVAEEIDEAALSAGAKAGPGEAAPVCSFRIGGGAPGAKVSWRVEALRNDRWVQQRGAPVEVEKQNLEKGTYQHPELYGQPKEKRMNYRAEHEQPTAAFVPNAWRPLPKFERPSPLTLSGVPSGSAAAAAK